MKVHLVRDILDKQVLDAHGVKISKVDGLVMLWKADEQPRIAWLEIGTITLARRLNIRFAHLAARLGKRLGGEQHGKPFRIPWGKITDIGVDIEVDVALQETPLNDWRKWLNERLVKRMFGG
jgi:sporulation protein YlmC with PRC-barrel domain